MWFVDDSDKMLHLRQELDIFKEYNQKQRKLNIKPRDSDLGKILKILQNCLLSNNYYIQKCRQLFSDARQLQSPDNARITFMDAKLESQKYKRQNFEGAWDNRTSTAASKQICALIPEWNEDTQTKASRIVLQIYDKNESGEVDTQTYNTHIISDFHPSVDALAYPIVFPFGTSGWNGWNKPPSATKFYRYRLQKHDDHDNCLLHFGRLTQQYMINAWYKAEQDRLNYFKLNAKKFITARGEDLQQILDGNGPEDLINVEEVGKRTILPSSFTGGPRYMRAQYHDAMALCGQYGKPTLFITFTCNGKWKEIQDELLTGETFHDRPDLCARVFQLKVKELIDDIKNKQIFGKCRAFVYTIEFQKRGLPHAHILVVLDRKYAPRNASDYDKFVSAEIPDKEKQPILYERVTSYMVHPDCASKPTLMCRKDNPHVCSKDFPKKFQPYTIQSEGAYPLYRRRAPEDGGHTHQTKHRTIDNRFIVPYNPYLIYKFNAHVNVEVCATVKAYKYIFKYIHKGPDKTTVQIENAKSVVVKNIDEIKNYVDCRYIGASEACWRLFEFNIHKKYPSVERLPVLLPTDEIRVNFLGKGSKDWTKEEIEAKLEANKINKVTAFFKLCHDNPELNITYPQVPEQFTWKQNPKEGERGWYPRQKFGKEPKIGRVYQASPTQGERYYLKVLLCNVKCPKSYIDLCTVYDPELERDVIYDTFHKAAVARGLVEDDTEAFRGMKEADKLGALAPQLRRLYIEYLINSPPAEIKKLFEQFKGIMSDDILHYQRKEQGNNQLQYNEQTEHTLLTMLTNVLKCMKPDATLYDYGMTWCRFNPNSLSDTQIEQIEQTEVKYVPEQCKNDFLNAIKTANSDQRYIILHMITQIIKQECYNSAKIISDCTKNVEQIQDLNNMYRLKKYQSYNEKINIYTSRIQRFKPLHEFCSSYLSKKIYEMSNPDECSTDDDDDLFDNNDTDIIYHQQILDILTNNLPMNHLKRIRASLTKKRKNVTFLHAFGGTGKTWVSNNILNYVRGQELIALPSASSGIAAILLEGGKTLHSQFQVPIPIDKTSTCKFDKHTKLGKKIAKASMIIYDEAIMQRKECLKALDRSLRDLMDDDKTPFGGKTMLLCGDFRQILPVILKGSREQIVESAINTLPMWKHFDFYSLNINERVKRNGNTQELKEFSEWLLKLGEGKCQVSNEEYGKDLVEIPDQLLSKSKDLNSFIKSIYTDLQRHFDPNEIKDVNLKYFHKRAILTTKNETVDDLNDYILREFTPKTEPEKTYTAINSVAPEDAWQLNTEYLKTFNPSGVPRHELRLKKGVPVMMMRNLDLSKGVCNGSRMLITHCGEHIIKAVLLDSENKEEILIPRIPISPSDGLLPYKWTRRQFPLRLAFSMTINKSQGQSLDKVGLYLPEPVFSHGQLYVGCSRSGSPKNLEILIKDAPGVQGTVNNKTYTKNFVWKEAFPDIMTNIDND